MKSGWKAIDDMGIEIDDETKEMTLENAIKFIRFYGINAVSKFSDNMLQLFGNEALRVIGKAIEDGYTLSQWIPCEERLPKVGEQCLLTVHYVELGDIECNRVIIGVYSDNYKNHILAWMPKPKPYEGKQNEI